MIVLKSLMVIGFLYTDIFFINSYGSKANARFGRSV